MKWLLSISNVLGHPKGFRDENYEYIHNETKSAYGKNTLIGWKEVSLSTDELTNTIQKSAFTSAIFNKKTHKNGQNPYAKREDASVNYIGNTIWFDIDGGTFNPESFYDTYNGKIEFIMTYGQSSPLGKTSFRILIKTPVVFSDNQKQIEEASIHPISDFERYYVGVANHIFGKRYSSCFDNFQGELSRFSAPLRNPHLDYSAHNTVWISDKQIPETLSFEKIALSKGELISTRASLSAKVNAFCTISHPEAFSQYITKETDDAIFVNMSIPIPYGKDSWLSVEELLGALKDDERISIGSIFQNTTSLPFYTIGYGFAYKSNKPDKSLIMECRSNTNKVNGLNRSKLVIVEKPIKKMEAFLDQDEYLVEEKYLYEGKEYICTGENDGNWFFALENEYVRLSVPKSLKAKLEVSTFDDIYFDIETGNYTFIKGSTVLKHKKSTALDMIFGDKDLLKGVDRLKSKYYPITKERRFIDPYDGVPSYNTFSPSKYLTPKELKEENIKPIEVLLNHLFFEQIDLKEQFINSLAHHLQTSGAIHLGWIFLGIEGAGKGVLMDFIFKLFGLHNCTKRKLTDFIGDKVKGIPDYQICFIDENLPENKSAEVVENLKAIIANKRYSSRGLYADAKQVDNFTMYFLAANDYGLKLSENDRRMNIVDCGKRLSSTVDNLDSFILELMSDNVVQSFANYLLRLEVNLKDIRTPIQSQFRNSTIESRLPTEALLVKCLFTNSLNPVQHIIKDEMDDEINDVETALAFFHDEIKYCGYCTPSNTNDIIRKIQALTFSKEFNLQIVKNFISKQWGKPKKKKVKGKSIRAYIIDEEKMESIKNSQDILFDDLDEI